MWYSFFLNLFIERYAEQGTRTEAETETERERETKAETEKGEVAEAEGA